MRTVAKVARWADRGNRATITSIAIGLWGVTVMSCLFVGNFLQLLCARIAAAVGQRPSAALGARRHRPLLGALARRDGVTGDPEAPTILAAGDLHLASRRLEVLHNVMAKGYVVQPDGRAVVGSRVTVRCVDGEQETYELVAPGEAEGRLRRISPDSPFGAALLGRRAGEVVYVLAPAGAEVLTVLSVA